MGPLLFLLYINNILNAAVNEPRLFADDMCLLLHNSNLSSLRENINVEISHLYEWCNSNKLKINPSKRNALIICPKLNNTITEFTVFLNNKTIEIHEKAKHWELQLTQS